MMLVEIGTEVSKFVTGRDTVINGAPSVDGGAPEAETATASTGPASALSASRMVERNLSFAMVEKVFMWIVCVSICLLLSRQIARADVFFF